MPVGLSPPSHFLPIAGVRLAAVAAGIRYQGRDDLVLIEFTESARSSVVLTQNALAAAPIRVVQAHRELASPRYLLINAGNANAGTGKRGEDDAKASCREVAARGECAEAAVWPFSTGVIGESLPMDKMAMGIAKVFGELEEGGWLRAAEAIMTTDTVPKLLSRELELAEGMVKITGMTKGSGMIRPDMATLLTFIATDAALPQPLLDEALRRAVAHSFNRISVDGDTSTNDACTLTASGGGAVRIDQAGEEFERFVASLVGLCEELAQAIVRDGEGATKFVTVEVESAADEQEASAVAYTVAHSPLVKSALFASDPNWGRIIAAAGRAGITAPGCDRLELFIGPTRIFADGARDPEYREEQGAALMAAEEITLRIKLHRGAAAYRVWTSDLSYEYVRINADYRS